MNSNLEFRPCKLSCDSFLALKQKAARADHILLAMIPVPRAHPGLCLLLAVLVLHITGCGGSSVLTIPTTTSTAAPVTLPVVNQWAGAWGVSPSNAEASPVNAGGSEQTYRFLIYPTLGGTQERVRFSNFFGSTPVTIGSARLAIGTDGTPQVDPANDVPLTFSGSTTVTLQPGQILSSDTISLSYHFGQSLAVSVYLKDGFPPLTRHDSAFIQNYVTPLGSGDQTSDTMGKSFTSSQSDWFLLSGLDVYGNYRGTVVILGSSTTDGLHANYGDTNGYPIPNTAVPGQHMSRMTDQLAVFLNDAGLRLGVVNAGISGGTLTPASNASTTHLQNGIDRFNRDVVQQTNVKVVIDYLGGIDIRGTDCKSAPEIEGAARQLVGLAASAKISVILATLPPSAFCGNPSRSNFGPTPGSNDPYAGGGMPGLQNGGETQRLAYNAWVRGDGMQISGVIGIADLDGAMSDPAHPAFLLPHLNSGDNYHPNGAGYKAAAGAVPLSLLQSATK